MTENREVVSKWLFRHFGDAKFEKYHIAFRYAHEHYQIKSVNEYSMTYGQWDSQMDAESEYYPENFSVRRSVLGTRIVFELVDPRY